jgi:hypothetical protein
MPAHSKFSDEQRIALATRKGDRMIGPLERQRCSVHPRRWETYRWTWRAPDESKGETQLMAVESDSEPRYERGCVLCAAEADDTVYRC